MQACGTLGAFSLPMFMLPLTSSSCLCLLVWRSRLPLVVIVARLVLCFLVHIFQVTALIACVSECV